VRHEIFRLDREHPRDLRDNGRQLFARRHRPVVRRVTGGFFGNFFPGRVGGSFAGRLSFEPSARWAFREGEGPRAVGFSFRRIFSLKTSPGPESALFVQ
jgi:hypothetical protein